MQKKKKRNPLCLYGLLVQIPLVCSPNGRWLLFRNRVALGIPLCLPFSPTASWLLFFFFTGFWVAVEVRDDNFHPVNEQETLGQDRKLHQALGEKSQERGKEKKKKCKKTALLVKGKKCQGGGEKEREAEKEGRNPTERSLQPERSCFIFILLKNILLAGSPLLECSTSVH